MSQYIVVIESKLSPGAVTIPIENLLNIPGIQGNIMAINLTSPLQESVQESKVQEVIQIDEFLRLPGGYLEFYLVLSRQPRL